MRGVRFGVLGPVTVWRDGEVITPTSATQRALLGVLLLAENRPLSTDRLVAVLRQGDGLNDARAWVHVVVSRLRTWLAKATDQTVTVSRQTDGYLLRAAEECVDLLTFRGLHAEATAADSSARQADLWDEALALWRGPALADVAAALHDDALTVQTDALRVGAALGFSEAALATGRPQRALPCVIELAAAHPLDERLHAACALLLAGSGRQSEALHLIERTRERLASELGIDLGEHLREAQLLVLRQQAMPEVRVVRETPPAVRWRGPRPDVAALVGRDRDRQALENALGHRRFVMVTGPGGCGKTALAMDLAKKAEPRFTDGVAVVCLASLRSFDEIVTAFASLMDVSAPTIDQTAAALTHALAQRHLLIVLDNCEHLAAECARFTRLIADHAPRVVVLATSQLPLGVVEEWVWPLGTLEVPAEGTRVDPGTPAVALFLRRALEALPTLNASDSDLELVGRLCRGLDGLPLAIELAAARLRALSIAQLVHRLTDNLSILDGPGRTLTATIDWSYRLLTEDEQRLLTRLSVFRGSFSLRSAEAVCGDHVLPVLVSLVERSLVLARDTNGSERRYVLLAAVREFAADRLADRDATHDRLLDHWLAEGRAVDALPHYRDRMERARALMDDGENIRAALDHGFGGTRQADAAETVVRLASFWLANRAHLGSSEVRMRQAIEHAGLCTPEVRGLLTYQSAVRRALREDYVGARQEMAAALPRIAANRQREYRDGLVSLVTNGRFVLNPIVLEQIPATLVALPGDLDGDEPSTALTACAGAYGTWGRFADAVELCARYAARAARRGTPFSVSHQVVRAEIAMGTGAIDEAVSWSRLLTEQLPGAGSPLEQEPARRAIALILLTTGENEAAAEFLTESISELDRRYPPEHARGSAHLGVLLAQAQRRAGDPEQARDSLAKALSQAVRRTHLRVGFTGALAAALVAADLGDGERSRELTRGWDTLRRRIGLPVPLGFADAPTVLGFSDGACGTPDPSWNWCAEELQEVIDGAHRWAVGLNQLQAF
ncbi:AAA family ATPase [Lentzea tibetensis]|uniref:AAA family ATPase n=1 Tax=Lentzea tibetensis TaxID=2591470 RepID=A0A563F1E5_9PSEU|nr:BTAD domain-containing putative transcriptional regulator [Lentzea tibetensis]TWP53723.1 AAA family ATPase [Lentzea tibetensis]